MLPNDIPSFPRGVLILECLYIGTNNHVCISIRIIMVQLVLSRLFKDFNPKNYHEKLCCPSVAYHFDLIWTNFNIHTWGCLHVNMINHGPSILDQKIFLIHVYYHVKLLFPFVAPFLNKLESVLSFDACISHDLLWHCCSWEKDLQSFPLYITIKNYVPPFCFILPYDTMIWTYESRLSEDSCILILILMLLLFLRKRFLRIFYIHPRVKLCPLLCSHPTLGTMIWTILNIQTLKKLSHKYCPFWCSGSWKEEF